MKYQRVAKVIVCVAAMTICMSCSTVRKGMESLKSIVKIYDTYEKPMSDITHIVTHPQDEEKDDA